MPQSAAKAGPKAGRREGGARRETGPFMLLRFMGWSHSKTNPNVYFPRSKL